MEFEIWRAKRGCSSFVPIVETESTLARRAYARQHGELQFVRSDCGN